MGLSWHIASHLFLHERFGHRRRGKFLQRTQGITGYEHTPEHIGMGPRHKLRNYIIAAFFINILAIVTIGGICTLLVRDMAVDIASLKTESRYVSKIYDLNNKTQEAIFLAENALVKRDREPLSYAIYIVEDLMDQVALYGEKGAEEDGFGLSTGLLFQKIEDNLSEINKKLKMVYENFSGNAALDRDVLKRLETYGYNIQNQVQAINTISFRKIERQVNDSNNKMYYILFMYLTSCLLGIIAACAGYIVLMRSVVRPIINLASATEKVAAGDLSVRVKTDTCTEIGTLYEAFNTMTERLQEHEKRREEFSRELERKVEERTSELKASKDSLRKAQDELIRMEKIATLGQIATSVNHEIKTPLNVLYMNLQLLNKKIKSHESSGNDWVKGMLELTSLINKEIIRINEIIEEFVNYARFPLPDIRENDLNKIVRDIAGMIDQKAIGANVSVKMSLDESLGKVPLDDKKMTQALLNLCINAIQAMPEGGDLHLETRREEESIVLKVADTGTGIPPEDLERIFQPFFTKKPNGTGFGLAIVQRIVEDHGGRIRCESRLGEGTTFIIQLPLKQKKYQEDHGKTHSTNS